MYTKKGWVKQGFFIFSAEKPPRLIAEIMRPNMSLQESEANANLIAAAPKYDEATKQACVAMSLRYGYDGDLELGYKEVEEKFGGGMAYAYKLLREAIALAKAEGKRKEKIA